MKLEKFPVISKSGNEYLVKIKDNSYFWVVDITIYQKGKIFNKKLESYSLTKSSQYWYLHNNLIELTKHFVKRYEKENLKLIVEYQLQQEGIRRFNEWDGKC